MPGGTGHAANHRSMDFMRDVSASNFDQVRRVPPSPEGPAARMASTSSRPVAAAGNGGPPRNRRSRRSSDITARIGSSWSTGAGRAFSAAATVAATRRSVAVVSQRRATRPMRWVSTYWHEGTRNVCGNTAVWGRRNKSIADSNHASAPSMSPSSSMAAAGTIKRSLCSTLCQ